MTVLTFIEKNQWTMIWIRSGEVLNNNFGDEGSPFWIIQASLSSLTRVLSRLLLFVQVNLEPELPVSNRLHRLIRYMNIFVLLMQKFEEKPLLCLHDLQNPWNHPLLAPTVNGIDHSECCLHPLWANNASNRVALIGNIPSSPLLECCQSKIPIHPLKERFWK